MKRSLCVLVLLCTAGAHGSTAPRAVYRIDTIAGSGNMGDGGLATAAQIGAIQGIARDTAGNLYLSDTDHHRVRKVDTKGVITVIAGTGTGGFSGDGGLATAAQLNLPYGLAVDTAGAVFIADLGNSRVRRVATDGTITTVAGNGTRASGGDGGKATAAQLLSPRNVLVDSVGNLYISEFEGHRVRRVSTGGTIATVAGTGLAGFSGDGGPATSAQLSYPAGLALDSAGLVYVVDSENQLVRRFPPGGAINTVLGGTEGTELLAPVGVAVDGYSTIYVADASHTVRAYTSDGKWNIVAGTGAAGFSGDGGAATAAKLNTLHDLVTTSTGVLYIADDIRIRRLSAGIIQTVAGDGYTTSIGDGSAGTAALLSAPSAVSLDWGGNLYIADTGTERVRRVTSAGIMQTVAGTGVATTGTDNVAASLSPLNSPMGLAMDLSGNPLIADTYNNVVRRINSSGLIAAIIGTGEGAQGAEGLAWSLTTLHAPRGICTDRAGTIYIADTSNHRILRAAQGATITTVAGNGSVGYAGDGTLARYAELDQPSACALDSAGNLFIADTYNNCIRKVTTDGVIGTVAGTGTPGDSGDEAVATSALLNHPRGVTADDDGNIFISDTGNHRIRQVTSDGLIHTIAGEGVAGFSGDGDTATAALLNSPQGIILDGSGDLYVADTNNNRIRRLVPLSTVATLSAALSPAIASVTAATLQAGAIAPGEILSITGTAIGPSATLTATLDSSGGLPTELGSVQVLFDGTPAPLFSVQAGLISVQAPYLIAGKDTTQVQVSYDGRTSDAVAVAVAAVAPAVFPTVANEDGSVNSASSPAARGSVVTFYATGQGLSDGVNISGQAATAPYAQPAQPVAVTVGGVAAEVPFAASAPGMVGVLQVNARIPEGSTGAQTLTLTVGGTASAAVSIWLK